MCIPTSFKPGSMERDRIIVDPDSVYNEIKRDQQHADDFVFNIPSIIRQRAARGYISTCDRSQMGRINIGPPRRTTRSDLRKFRLTCLPRDSAAIGYTQPRILSSREAEIAVSIRTRSASARLDRVRTVCSARSSMIRSAHSAVSFALWPLSNLKDVTRCGVEFRLRITRCMSKIRSSSNGLERTTKSLSAPPPIRRASHLLRWIRGLIRWSFGSLNITGEFNTLGEIGIFSVTDNGRPEY